MALIIKDGVAATDPWQLLKLNTNGSFPAVPPSGDIIVQLAMWLDQRDKLPAHPGRLGVLLESNEKPEDIAGDLGLFGVVAVNFPKLTDGRGYSIGRLLRERYGWRGELRAVGDVQRDQIRDLSRCGFDAFALREGEDPREAQTALGDFTEAYQTAVDTRLPLFRRRILDSPDGVERK